jgi:D-tyrosyl-tRNA(Tyr) deacylase
VLDIAQVTIEIDTDPPKLDLPGEPMSGSVKETMDINDLVGKMAKLNTEFVLPAELLE